MTKFLLSDRVREQLVTPSSVRVRRAARARDTSDLASIVRDMHVECSRLYDAYLRWLSAIERNILTWAGQESHLDAVIGVAEQAVGPFVAQYAGLSFPERVHRLAQRLRASGSTFSVLEGPESVRFVLDPWGPERAWSQPYGWEREHLWKVAGDRVRYPLFGGVADGADRASAHQLNGRATIMALEAQFLEVVPVRMFGAPLAVLSPRRSERESTTIEVPKSPMDVPDHVYECAGVRRSISSLEGSKRDRCFGDDALQRLSTPLALQVRTAGEDRDWDRLSAIAATMDSELVAAKDPLGIAIAGLLSWIARHLGERRVYDSLVDAAAVVMSPFLDGLRDLDPVRSVAAWASAWRAHGSTFVLEEHTDVFVFRGSPLGACHRMLAAPTPILLPVRSSAGRVRYPTFGVYDPPTAFHRLRFPHAMTQGRVDYPVYSAHCHVFHEIYPMDQLGYPLWVEEHPTDPRGDTIHIHYKDRSRWPAHYYTRVGREKAGGI